MKYTNNYNLKKPDGNDAVQIEDFNNNVEIIDYELAKRALKGELTEGLKLKIDNVKKSDSVTLDSSDSVATSKAVKVAYDKGSEALGKANRNETQLADNSTYSTYKLGIDSNDIYTEINRKRANGTLIIKSILSGGTSPNYTTKTETKYGTDGITVEWTKAYALTYNTDGILLSEVLI